MSSSYFIENGSEQKTYASNFLTSPDDAFEEVRVHFRSDEQVQLGFNCKKAHDFDEDDSLLFDEDDSLLFQAVISNFSDLEDEANRWAKGTIKELSEVLRSPSAYDPREFYSKYPHFIQD